MKKQKLVVVGNCQRSGIIHYLYKSEEFRNLYDCKHYANWEMIKNKESIPIQELKSADCVIYQPLREEHGIYSTDPTVENSIGYFIKDTSFKIGFPFVYSTYMWPLYQKSTTGGAVWIGNDPNSNRAEKNKGNHWVGAEPIDELLESGLTVNDIVELYNENKIDWKYQERYDDSISILKDKEKTTHVKISPFIEKNLSKNLLFLIPGHPSSLIFLTMANQILEKHNMQLLDSEEILSYNEVSIPDTIYHNPDGVWRFCQSSIDFYNLEYGEEFLNKNFYINKIKEYCNSKK